MKQSSHSVEIKTDRLPLELDNLLHDFRQEDVDLTCLGAQLHNANVSIFRNFVAIIIVDMNSNVWKHV